jgi:hypothetical protein
MPDPKPRALRVAAGTRSSRATPRAPADCAAEREALSSPAIALRGWRSGVTGPSRVEVSVWGPWASVYCFTPLSVYRAGAMCTRSRELPAESRSRSAAARGTTSSRTATIEGTRSDGAHPGTTATSAPNPRHQAQTPRVPTACSLDGAYPSESRRCSPTKTPAIIPRTPQPMRSASVAPCVAPRGATSRVGVSPRRGSASTS